VFVGPVFLAVGVCLCIHVFYVKGGEFFAMVKDGEFLMSEAWIVEEGDEGLSGLFGCGVDLYVEEGPVVKFLVWFVVLMAFYPSKVNLEW